MNMTHMIDYGVIGLLAVMSVVAVAVAIERYRFYNRVDPDSYKAIQLYEADLTKRLYIVATIGTNAPYIGLLGTVLGIMHTFYAMGVDGSTNVNAIMTGLALALKATAAGLVAAIPAIILYNVLHRKVNEMLLIKEADNEGKKL